MSAVYLTKLTLNPYAKEVRRTLENRYALHRIAYSLKGEGREGRLLWRLEPPNGRAGAVILVQTPYTPDLGYVLERGLGYAETRRVELRLTPGSFAFRLEANAVRRHEQRARPLLDPEEQVQWLEERLAPMKLLEVVPVRAAPLAIKKPGGDKYTLHAVLFEGRLEVGRDAVAEAQRMMLEGIGRGRSMGLGMLSLKRARSAGGT